jgi:prepilin-type N-terminal cleavage/methylation domain-containing protein
MRNGFSLVELLVVITIIVVLLSLLAPALEKAIYRAELAVCASQLRGIGSSVTIYAQSSRSYYPYRGLGRVVDANVKPPNYDQPAEIKYHPAVTARPFDQRTTLIQAMPALNKQMNDPLTKFIEIDQPALTVFSPYNLWWEFAYYNQANTEVMYKIGDSFTCYGERFTALAGDRDLVRPTVDAQCSHPDDVYQPGLLRQLHKQNEQGPWVIAPGGMTISCWYSDPSDTSAAVTDGRRSPVDNNYVMSDLSVAQVNRIRWDKSLERDHIRTVSTYSNGWQGGEFDYMYIP